MSDAFQHKTESSVADPEAGISFKYVVAVGVISLVIFGISAVVAAIILNADRKVYEERGVAGKGALVGQDEIGIVDQVHFDLDERLGKWRAERAHHMASYGWVDRSKGIIHIPIERAMKEFVQQAGGGQ